MFLITKRIRTSSGTTKRVSLLPIFIMYFAQGGRNWRSRINLTCIDDLRIGVYRIYWQAFSSCSLISNPLFLLPFPRELSHPPFPLYFFSRAPVIRSI